MFDWEGWKMLNIFTQKLNVTSPNMDKKGPVQLLAQTISRGGECEGCNPFQSYRVSAINNNLTLKAFNNLNVSP